MSYFFHLAYSSLNKKLQTTPKPPPTIKPTIFGTRFTKVTLQTQVTPVKTTTSSAVRTTSHGSNSIGEEVTPGDGGSESLVNPKCTTNSSYWIDNAWKCSR